MAKQTPKKTPKKMPIKKMAMKQPVAMTHDCGCEHNCPCGCHKHGAAHLIKHIIVWAIIFALGMACGKMMNCRYGKKMFRPMPQPVFTNGCLDMASIKCPKMSEEIVVADVNADNCISVEEYKAWRRANKTKMRANKKHGEWFRGKKSK